MAVHTQCVSLANDPFLQPRRLIEAIFAVQKGYKQVVADMHVSVAQCTTRHTLYLHAQLKHIDMIISFR